MERAQRRRRILDHVAAFYSQQTSDPSRLMDSLDVVRSSRLLQLRAAVDEPQRHIELS